MPHYCCINGCKSISSNVPGGCVGFFAFPSVRTRGGTLAELAIERRNRWFKAINKKTLNTNSARVCSKHFISGKCAKLQDNHNPDWVPSLNLGHETVPLVPENILKIEMSEPEEREITFEEIGIFSKNTPQADKIKKMINLNLKIKRIPKATIKEIQTPDKPKPTPKKEKKKIELIPTLCNGTSCPSTDEIMDAIDELRDLIKKNCKETHEIRQEIYGIKESIALNDNPSYVPFMRGPCQTFDDLNLLENRVSEDEISRKALETLLDKIPDLTLDKYVRSCARAIFGDRVAAQCSWRARKNTDNVSVQDMTIIRIICDCIRKRFPTASSSLIGSLIKEWFLRSHERWRKSAEAKHLKSEVEAAIKNIP
ncbi:uncharacterized protein LOC129909876 isoform X1 [Episyrphus balteatus]|uniref:uncharacterized protein LOC129909876 isoform X1 n=1 Tax=Episyrphus balteatus TaxID=286459 RepID=UPI0024852D7F|nr:uncharacterized protein LOC129909876 isoform X1 [Episyrphus balteatus]